jgi:hypothetical protein
MKKAWPWIIGGFVGLVILGFLWAGRSERQAYRVARGAIDQRVEDSQVRINTAVQMATDAVDLALKLAGDLPSQQAKADLVKQDIQEIGSRLRSASEATGDAAVDKLNQSIQQFNTTLENVDAASKEAETPAVKATLDRIYGALLAAKDQLVNVILGSQESK